MLNDYPVITNFCEGCQKDNKFVFLTWGDDFEGDEVCVYECATCESEMILTPAELKEVREKAAK